MSILILGDFFYGYDYISPEILAFSQYIKQNGFSVILNLEGVITDSNSSIKKRGEHLRQSKRIIEVLKLLNVKGVTLANNHIYDFGEQGLLDTIAALDKNGIQHTGAGKSFLQAIEPIKLQIGECIYKFYSMTDAYEEAICINEKKGTSGSVKLSTEIVDKFEENTKSILILHTGFEYNTIPMPRNIWQNHNFIDSGADAIICMHPHVTQPIEIYKDKVIAYSLGNFYFSNFTSEFAEKTIKGKSKGFCNIGYGIIIKENTKEFIQLDIANLSNPILPFNVDHKEILCAQKIKRFSIAYIFRCIKNRNNHNPILLGYVWADCFLLFLLDCAYLMYAVYKKLITIG